MKEVSKKRKLIIGVNSELSKNERDFFSGNFDIETVTFQKLLSTEKKRFLDLLYFNGGADVNPEFYGQKMGSRTSINKSRDIDERQVFDIYYEVPKLGICRGSQLITVLSGGSLIQHVDGHANGQNHLMDVHFDGNNSHTSFEITSTHHQMMYPYVLNNDRYKLLAWASPFRSLVYLDGEDMQMKLPKRFVEPEIVYYPFTRALAIQGHPEYSNCPKNTKNLCLDLVESYLLK